MNDMKGLGGGWGLYDPEPNTKPIKILPYLMLSAILFFALFAVFA